MDNEMGGRLAAWEGKVHEKYMVGSGGNGTGREGNLRIKTRQEKRDGEHHLVP